MAHLASSRIANITEGVDFSEGASAKWIFDVEIEKFRAEISCKCREDQNSARSLARENSEYII
jgi:hypothetical protein